MTLPGNELRFWKCMCCQTPNPDRAYVRNCVACGALRQERVGALPLRLSLRFPGSVIRDWLLAAFRGVSTRAVQIGHWTAGRLQSVWKACAGPLFWLTVCYLAFMALVMVLAWTLGDRWFPATLLLYSPRLLWLIPLVLLMAATGFSVRRALVPIQLLILLGIGLTWVGFQFPVSKVLASQGPGPVAPIRVMSFNGQYGEHLEVDSFLQFLRDERIDVVCLQEFHRSLVEQQPRLKSFFDQWHWDGTGYIVSRLPIAVDRGSMPDPKLGYLPNRGIRGWITVNDSNGQEFDVVNLYIQSLRTWFGHFLVLDRVRMDLYESERRKKVQDMMAFLAPINRPLVIAGDFNTAADSPLFRPFLTRYRDAFKTAGWGLGSTFPSNMPWFGIDHILVDDHWRIRQCKIGANQGPDHRPLVAELELLRPGPTAP